MREAAGADDYPESYNFPEGDLPPSDPLVWPIGRRRTEEPQPSRFGEERRGQTLSWAREELQRQLRLLGTTDHVVTLNRGARRGEDQGVAVYFQLEAKRYCLSCDRWDRQADNLWAVAKHIDAIRGQQRWGVGTIEAAFAGYRALSAVGVRKSWREVLGFPRDYLPSQDELDARVRELRLRHHPDRGGNGHQMAEMNAAFNEAREELGY